MVTCPKCNKELNDGTKFCDSCNTQIFETVLCPNCDKQTSTEFTLCQNCGAPIAQGFNQEQLAALSVKKLKSLPMSIIFGLIGVVVALLVLIIILFSGGSNDYALYLKDNEIFFTDFKEDSKAWQVTSRFVDMDDIDNDDLAHLGNWLGYNTYMSEDGKYIFFPDKINEDDDAFSLYYREVENRDAEAIKVDSDIQYYFVNDSATLVTYVKGVEANLYQYKIGEDSKDKIVSEVKDFNVSDDGNKILYIDSENGLYLKCVDKEKEKIASDISNIKYVNEDFTTIYYMKDDSLYKQVKGKDKEKIASDITGIKYTNEDFTTIYYIKENSLYKKVEGKDTVKIASDIYDVLKIYDSGEIYYLKKESLEIPLMNYVIDDMKESDAVITMPEYPTFPSEPEYPSLYLYDTYEEWNAACDAAYNEWDAVREQMEYEYYEARDVYLAKAARDELREKLKEKTFKQDSYSLCFYNGKEEVEITDAFINYSDTCASDAPVISYEIYDQSEVKKLKISEVESTYDIEDMIEEALFSSTEIYITTKDEATLIEPEKEVSALKINSTGTIVYYLDNIPDGKEHGDLYRISISGGVPGKAELYDSDVYYGYCLFVGDTDQYQYFKDCKDYRGEMYINKNKIDYDVDIYSVDYYSDLDKMFYYYTDWNDDKEHGTLKAYDGKKVVKIADEVHSHTVDSEGRVLYLYDYSLNHYKGELHEWFNGKTRKIDDDVVCIAR